ncbi:MAG: hypothetical protein ACK5KP_04950 [Paludibacteraceae bacterium]
MRFFDFFRMKSTKNEDTADKDENLPDIEEDDFVDRSDPIDHENSSQSVEFGSKLPIDLIYAYLKEDYEQKAYNDALTNPDKYYKEMNLEIIKSNLDVKFMQVELKYNDLLREISFHIKSRSEAGLTDIVELLRTNENTYKNHLEILHQMKKDLANKESYMMGIFKSYEVGFTRGLASLSLEKLKIDTV